MTKDCENIYKASRNNAGVSQEKAADLLNVSTRSLAEYESSRRIVPEDIVISMAEIYNCPTLRWRHGRINSAAGALMPKIEMPIGDADAYFQLTCAYDDFGSALEALKPLIRNGCYRDKPQELACERDNLNEIRSLLASGTVYIDWQLRQLGINLNKTNP